MRPLPAYRGTDYNYADLEGDDRRRAPTPAIRQGSRMLRVVMLANDARAKRDTSP